MSGTLPHDLNPRQLEAATSPDGPLLITAGAGSGKTKTLTSRLLYLIDKGIPANKIVAITFTNKAASEMKSRAENLIFQRGFSGTPFIGTFHSFCARILRIEAHLLDRSSSFSIYDDDDTTKTIKQALKKLDIDSDKRSLASIKNKISKIKSEFLNLEHFSNDKDFINIFHQYENLLKEQNAFDFDDLIQKLVSLLEGNSQILDSYQNRFTHFLVDEYQDVNTAQYKLIKILSSKHKNINVVGDDHQSIYSFRSADFRNFLNFEIDYPEAKIVTLDQNYRSTKNIITASSLLISHNLEQRPKTLWTDNEEGSPIQILKFNTADDEASWIAKDILYKQSSSSKAILYRTNAQSRQIEQALILERIPYTVFGGLKFYDRKEIKDIVAILRVINNPKDEASAERILKEFGKINGRRIVAELPPLEKDSPTALITEIIKLTDYNNLLIKKFKNYDERMENLKELITFSNNFDSLGEMIERISLLEATDTTTNQALQRVILMTIHMSKGLEFDSVYIAGVNDGILPHERSLNSIANIEEERRLMYVAMTRAKKNLAISFFGVPSRFIFEIPSEAIQFENFNFDEDEIYLS